MTVPPDLTSSELEEALELSRLKVFQKLKPQSEPVGIVLGGQPASGKSSLIERIKQDRQTPFAVINGDEFRYYHPRFNEYNQQNEREAVHKTQPLANYIGQTLLKEAINNRYNIIIEGTMRTAAVPMKTADQFRQAGYTVEAHALAVPYNQSLQGIYSRYEHQKELGQSGRFSPLPVHQEAYTGLLITVDQLHQQKAVDRLVIYNRGAKTILADFQLKNKEWSTAEIPSRLVELERNRRWTPQEKVEHALRWETIINLREKRGAEPDPLPQQMHGQIMREINHQSLAYRAYREQKESGQQQDKNRGFTM